MGGGNLPFGFNPQDHEPGRPEDVTGKIPLFAELQKLLSWSGGPVNWDLARQMAISAIAGDYRPVSETETAEVRDAIRLADLWLDAVTDLPSGGRPAFAWQWVRRGAGGREGRRAGVGRGGGRDGDRTRGAQAWGPMIDDH